MEQTSITKKDQGNIKVNKNTPEKGLSRAFACLCSENSGGKERIRRN